MEKVIKYKPGFKTCVEILFDTEEECLKYEEEFAPFYNLMDEIDGLNLDSYSENVDYEKEAIKFLEKYIKLYMKQFKNYTKLEDSPEKLAIAIKEFFEYEGVIWEEVCRLTDMNRTFFHAKYSILDDILEGIIGVYFGLN